MPANQTPPDRPDETAADWYPPDEAIDALAELLLDSGPAAPAAPTTEAAGGRCDLNKPEV
jgi:hypothetical protein